MLLVKRLGELRGLEEQLAHVSLREAAAAAGAAKAARPLRDKWGGSDSGDPRADHSHIADQKNKLLFRRIPQLLSLVERSLSFARAGRSPSSATSAHHARLRQAIGAMEVLPNRPTTLPIPTKTRSSRSILSVSQAKSLLKALHTGEEARKQYYDNLAAQTRNRRLAYERQLEQARRKLRGVTAAAVKERRKHESSTFFRDLHGQNAAYRERQSCKVGKTTAEHEAEVAELERGVESLWREVQQLRDDERLLHGSLIARPFLSARMWELLLEPGLWQSIQRGVLRGASSAEALRPSDASHAPQDSHLKLEGISFDGPPKDRAQSDAAPAVATQEDLLALLLAFSRLALGVLRHATVPTPRNSHSINKYSPRFVRSLPSRRRRSLASGVPSKKDCVAAAVSKVQDGADSAAVTPLCPSVATGAAGGAAVNVAHDHHGYTADDLMEMMLMPLDNHAIPSVKAASGATELRALQDGQQSSHRECAVAPKPPDTACSLRWMPPAQTDVLPLVGRTVKLMASLVPSLNPKALVARGYVCEVFELLSTLQVLATSFLLLQSPQQVDEATHDTLRQLEQGLMASAVAARDAFVDQSGGAAKVPHYTLGPPQAARLLLSMHRLQLLQEDIGGCCALHTVAIGLQYMFPFLSTNTHQTLLAKARETSLHAFCTRGYRRKIRANAYRDGQSYGGSAPRTPTQESRLIRRQMSAALREQQLHGVEEASVQRLVNDLPLRSLCTLLSLCARALASVSPHARRTNDRRVALMRVRSGAVFIADAIVRAALQRQSTAAADADDDAVPLSLTDLSSLMLSISVLWPEIENYGAASKSAADHPELGVMGSFAAFLLESTNAIVAARTGDLLRSAPAEREHADSLQEGLGTVASELTLHELRLMATAVGQLSEVLLRPRGFPAGRAALLPAQREVIERLLSSHGLLVKRLILSDVALLRQARRSQGSHGATETATPSSSSLPQIAPRRQEQSSEAERLASSLSELLQRLGVMDFSLSTALDMLSRHGFGFIRLTRHTVPLMSALRGSDASERLPSAPSMRSSSLSVAEYLLLSADSCPRHHDGGDNSSGAGGVEGYVASSRERAEKFGVGDVAAAIRNSAHRTGLALLEITDKRIDIDLLHRRFLFTSGGSGAVSTFVGITREHDSSRSHGEVAGTTIVEARVLHLEYEAYTALALRRFAALSSRLFQTLEEVDRVVMVHRIGQVIVGEPSVFIGISAAHRRPALQAVDLAIEEIKRCLPVWKREVTAVAVHADASTSPMVKTHAVWRANV